MIRASTAREHSRKHSLQAYKFKLPANPFLAATLHLHAAGGTPLSPARGIPNAKDWPLAVRDAKILELSASELARRIQARELRSEEVVRAFVGQIARHNTGYNAIVLLDLNAALERARAADEALIRGEVWGPLHGVPVTIKDTYVTRGLRTTAGAPDLLNYVPEEDAVIVTLLRRAGAIVLAKTNAATLAMDMQTTNNPWDVQRTVGGSSGGCAAAVAARQRWPRTGRRCPLGPTLQGRFGYLRPTLAFGAYAPAMG